MRPGRGARAMSLTGRGINEGGKKGRVGLRKRIERARKRTLIKALPYEERKENDFKKRGLLEHPFDSQFGNLRKNLAKKLGKGGKQNSFQARTIIGRFTGRFVGDLRA